MYFKKAAYFLFFNTVLFINVLAQPLPDFSSNWKMVEGLEKKGLSRSALTEVKKIFDLAVTSGNQPQQVKAAMYQMKYRNLIEEDNQENNIFYLDTLIAKTKSPAKNILLSMQAQLFLSYREANRYKFYDRTILSQETSHDITTWSIEKLNSTISSVYKLSLKNETILKNTLVDQFGIIIDKGENTRQLRPTLYDLLIHRALNYFVRTENDITQPAYKFILNDERIFLPVIDFIKIKFATKDTSSLYYNALLLFQEILKFHANDHTAEPLIDADLERLQFANNFGVFTNKERLYEEGLLNLESRYNNNSATAQAMYLRAKLYIDRGLQYDPETSKQNQFEIRRGKELADSVIKIFPKSEGATESQELLNQVKIPNLIIETEKVNLINQPFRTFVKYKNVSILYLRIIKTSREEMKKIIESGYESNWQQVTSLTPMQSLSINLPNLQDYQQHSTEIKMPSLTNGVYMILASINPEFNLTQNIIARQFTYVSNISYVTDNKDDMYILNRNNGLPLNKAEVQLWSQQYNYTNRRYEEIKREKYFSDVNGFIRIKKPKESFNIIIQVKHENDELFLDDNNQSYYYNSYKRQSVQKTFLFTDRSIYRPGQVISFKGIVVSTDSTGRKSTIMPGFKTTVSLYDANNQKVAAIDLQTNEYGSYNGRFTLPQGSLNGQFYIRDSLNNSSQYFSVEDYKRPKFMVEINKPSGTYRLNDSIHISGFAKAFAGNNIDGAKVTYRVMRKVRMPVWWGWNKMARGRSYWPLQGEEMEITNGETVTNATGEFYLEFLAIPDETIDKKEQPTFYYEVITDITDINGETRSANISVAAAYQALQLSISSLIKLEADSLSTVKITSTNMNDVFEKVMVNVSLYKLIVPAGILNERYWEKPDLFVMSKEEFHNSFPYDVYSDEDQVKSWPLGEKVIDKSAMTSENGGWPLLNGQLKTGWYKIIALAKDKYGEEVKAEHFIQLTNGSGEAAETKDKISITVKPGPSEPGDEINYTISTAFDQIHLIQTLSKADQSLNTILENINIASAYKNQIRIEENDRGGMNLSYVFVKHNRVYSGNQFFAVPWNTKELKISYETFRDKVLPGSEEKWKIKISGNKKEKVAAEALISMYDASLDQFINHEWTSLSSLWPIFSDYILWSKNGFTSVHSQEYNRIVYTQMQRRPKSYDEIINNGWNEFHYRNRTLSLRGAGSMPVMDMASPSMAADEKSGDKIQEVIVTSANQTKRSEKLSYKDNQATDSISTSLKNKETQNNNIQVRKNFNETAFFFPSLLTDANGNIEFSFTIPEALTKWKMLTIAHSKELSSGYSEMTMITQKPLMIQPNVPRFLREGDQVEFSAKMVNLDEKEITGTVELELFDVQNNKPADGWFKNLIPVQYFTVASGQSALIKFPLSIPENYNSALVWRLKAISKDDTFSDGEESVLPVLANRILVTESMPFHIRNESKKTFSFEKLINSGNSKTLTNHSLTIEYTNNPTWYAVQALPYLAEFPYECAEQMFNRYYANALAEYIANSTPGIKAVFEKWLSASMKNTASGNADSLALISNLQKNEELKSVLLQETPWVLEAQNETQQKKNIALLFDLANMSKQKNSTFDKLKELQSSNGGFTWFKGGPDDRYITQYIITGIGHLRKLNALSDDDYKKLKTIVNLAIPYLDARLKEDYDELVKHKSNLRDNHLSYQIVQYLYMRSFFSEYKMNDNVLKAYNYYRLQTGKFWLTQNKYMQAMIALSLFRNGDAKTPKAIISSLKENAIYKDEMGMYFKEFTSGGYYWFQAPVESQAMIIEAFTDIDKDPQITDDLKTWLLKQKQTQNWRTTKATAEACYALLLNNAQWLNNEKQVLITIGNTTLKPSQDSTETGTGYFKRSFSADQVKPEMGNIGIEINMPPGKPLIKSPSWGAVYWQYFENLDKITPAETPLKLTRKLFVEKNSDRGPTLVALNEGDELNIGDKVKVRIELNADRDMEYIHMKDLRAACMEPVNVLSQYKWQGGLGYYESTLDASTNFFFAWLPRGSYVFEYPMFVTHSGNFSNGITTIQCMYAPEFTSHSNGVRVTVAEK